MTALIYQYALSAPMITFCRKYAALRYFDAKRKGVHNFRRGANETDAERVADQTDGLFAEATVLKAFGGAGAVWNYYVADPRVDLQTLPEIVINGTNIDAKAANPNWYSLLCPLGSVKPSWAYVLVGVEHAPICYIYGWMWGREVLRVDPNDPRLPRRGHLIPQGDPRLRDLQELANYLGRPLAPTSQPDGWDDHRQSVDPQRGEPDRV